MSQANMKGSRTYICPGCGWFGTRGSLIDGWECPNCNYECPEELPCGFPTLTDYLYKQVGIFNQVDMTAFLKTLFYLMRVNGIEIPQHLPSSAQRNQVQ